MIRFCLKKSKQVTCVFLSNRDKSTHFHLEILQEFKPKAGETEVRLSDAY